MLHLELSIFRLAIHDFTTFSLSFGKFLSDQEGRILSLVLLKVVASRTEQPSILMCVGLVLALLGLPTSLPSVSLGQPVPAEVLLRPSSSDAKNAATLFLQGCTCSVAFLRIYIIYICIHLYCRLSA